MGCVVSKIDNEERVQICKERKRLMKKLVRFRREFAEAQVAYLKALRNIGVTLKQFTEFESLELENASYGQTLPASPPLSLPPSPPPPPPFSPSLSKCSDNQKDEVARVESVKIDENGCLTPPPPGTPSSSWEIWDPFEHYVQHHQGTCEMVEMVTEEENWAETRSEFDEDDQELEFVKDVCIESLQKKQQQGREHVECVEDILSSESSQTKDTADMAMVVRRSKKTLDGIIKDLDDYFLKSSASGKEVAVLMDIFIVDSSSLHDFKENKRKRSNHAKVLSALSWSWSSKSLQLAKDAEVRASSDPCKAGAHCVTLDKLYAAEKKLCKEVREVELTKSEHERKSMILARQEEENHGWTKTEKIRSHVEALETDIRRLQSSISRTCSSILELIDQELYPQLNTLTAGLSSMWKTMYECHQVQRDISQQLNHITGVQHADFTTENRQKAICQLENEVASWYLSFSKLMKFQQEYATALGKWIQLTNGIANENQQTSWSSVVHNLCEEWKLAFDRLPQKIASDAIEGLSSAIQSIKHQQEEELSLQKKSDKLEKRLQKELASLAEMEKRLEWSIETEDMQLNLSHRHPLSLRCAKTEILKTRVDTEKTKYLNSVQVTRVMTLSNLKTSLPNLFQALMTFSSASAKAFAAIHSNLKPAAVRDATESSSI